MDLENELHQTNPSHSILTKKQKLVCSDFCWNTESAEIARNMVIDLVKFSPSTYDFSFSELVV